MKTTSKWPGAAATDQAPHPRGIQDVTESRAGHTDFSTTDVLISVVMPTRYKIIKGQISIPEILFFGDNIYKLKLY